MDDVSEAEECVVGGIEVGWKVEVEEGDGGWDGTGGGNWAMGGI